MKTNRIIMLVMVAALMVVFGVNLASNASSYTSFENARNSSKKVHIAGEWIRRTEVVEEENMFQFYVQDSLNNVEFVTYYEPKPNNFEQADKVVLIGGYREEGFVADKIITKCPSKYNETEIKLEE